MVFLSLYLVAAVAVCVQAQQGFLLKGQGSPPEGIVTDVALDVYFDGMRSVNPDLNSFASTAWIHLSWNDTRAEDALRTATGNWLDPNNLAAHCDRACDSSNQFIGGCCDKVWLPQIESPNMVLMKEESVPAYRIWIEPNNPRAVHWMTRVSGEWYSPMDFNTFPFDTQHLLMEFQVAQVLTDKINLVIKDVAFLETTPHTKNGFAPGWHMTNINKRIFNTQACTNKLGNIFSRFRRSAFGLLQLATLNISETGFSQVSPQGPFMISVVPESGCHPGHAMATLSGYQFPEAMASYNAHIVTVDISISRTRSSHVLTKIVPLLLLSYMVFVTFTMKQEDIASRMVVIVVLVLAVTGLQTTWSAPPASYMNALQQLTLTTYILFFIAAIGSMVVSYVTRYYERARHNTAIITQLSAGASPNSTTPNINSFAFTNNKSFEPFKTSIDLSEGAGSGLSSPRSLSVLHSVFRQGLAHCIPGKRSWDKDQQTGTKTSGDFFPFMKQSRFSGSQTRSLGVEDDGTEVTILPTLPTVSSIRARKSGGPNTATNDTADDLDTITLATPEKNKVYSVANSPMKPAGSLGADVLQRIKAGSSSRGASPKKTHSNGSHQQQQQQQPSLTMKMSVDCEVAGENVGLNHDKAPRATGQGAARALFKKHSTGRKVSEGVHKFIGKPLRVFNIGARAQELKNRMTRDQAFAYLVGTYLDRALCWTLIVSYTTTVTILLIANTQAGDGKFDWLNRTSYM